MMNKTHSFAILGFTAIVWLVGAVATFSMARADEIASPWQLGHQSKARLVAGAARDAASGERLAGVEITMAKNWKTYWRTPGDAGGVPPGFDWSGSENIAQVEVLYPAPRRLVDKGGETIGYKGGVTFPVRVVPKEGSKPVRLVLVLTYGICLDICIPAETNLTLDVPAGDLPAPPPNVIAALAEVPRAAADRRTGDPKLEVLRPDAKGIAFDVSFSAAASAVDAFVEGPEGIGLSMPRRDGAPRDGRQRFIVEATADEVSQLKGKPLIVTLTAQDAAVEYRVPLAQ